MPTSSAHFTVIYDGAALRSHEMDVRELAPALLALGDLLQASNSVLNGDKIKLEVKVKAFRGGSFGVDMVLLQSCLDSFMSLFDQTSQFRHALEILSLLGFTFKDVATEGGRSLIALIKASKGRKPSKIEPAGGGNYTLVFQEGSRPTIITVPNGVLKLYEDKNVHTALENSLAPLSYDGIDGFGISEHGESRILVTRDELEDFTRPDESGNEDLLGEAKQIRIFEIRSLSFMPGNKWRLFDGSGIKHVKIEDEEFLKKVEAGLPFSNGDMLKVELVTRQSFNKGKLNLNMEYFAVKVLDIIRRPAQLPLPLDSNEHD